MNFNTGDKDLDIWLKFFTKKPIKNTLFLNLLSKIDKTFLTSSPYQEIDNEYLQYLPLNGLLENDFKEVAFNKISSDAAKARIALSIYHNVNFDNWKNLYGEIFLETIQICIIEGNYEVLGISFEQILSLAVKNNIMDKSSFVETAIMRGVTIDNRYPDEKSEKLLKWTVIQNKIKMKLGFLNNLF